MPTIKITAADLKTIKEQCKAIAKKHSRASRFQIEIGERYNIDTAFDRTSINVLSISNDPTGEWNDTDLNTTVDFSTLRKPLEMTEDGRAIVDFYIYEWDSSFREWGDLVTNAQAEFDMSGLKAMHCDMDKNVWTR